MQMQHSEPSEPEASSFSGTEAFSAMNWTDSFGLLELELPTSAVAGTNWTSGRGFFEGIGMGDDASGEEATSL